MRLPGSSLLALTALSVCTACMPPDTTPTEDAGVQPTLSGSVKAAAGKQVPAIARTMVLWAGGNDLYKYGEGTSTGASFSIDVPKILASEALNARTVGVGILVLVGSGTQVAEGKTDTDIVESIIGAAEDFAFIYRAGGANEDLTYREWIKDFPIGLSCARGVEKEEGFDAFKPVPCESIPITVDDIGNIHLVNWT